MATTAPPAEYLTTTTIAELLGVSPDKILSWIRAGELRAIDVSTTRGQRPRWRISRSDLEEFGYVGRAGPPAVARRVAVPRAKQPRRRRRKPEGVTEYY